MPKRKGIANDGPAQSPKRRRVGHLQLDQLSDELLIRILSYLSPNELGVSARASRRLLRLANDNESWKERYYSRWVRPRVLRIPSSMPRAERDTPRYSAKSANWLDHRHLVFPPKITNWKWQYRIRNNWHRGSCNVQALQVSQPPTAPSIITTHEGLVFEAASAGLRAWSTKDSSILFSTKSFEAYQRIPTAMALDTSEGVIRLGIGFADSSFQCYIFSQASGFTQCGPVQNFLDIAGPVKALSMQFPFVFAYLSNSTFRLQRLVRVGSLDKVWEEVVCLQSGRQHEISPSLTLRRIGKEISASIAYTFEQVGRTNWCLGIQEVRVPESTLHSSNLLGTSEPSSCSTQSSGSGDCSQHLRTLEAWTPAFPQDSGSNSRPRILTYAHPYLLAALPDNTMMVYLVTSTSDKLSLSQGSRLWGHTAGISGVGMNARGKAITTTIKGGEVRVWDLESLARGIAHGKTSVPLVPIESEGSSSMSSSAMGADVDYERLALRRSWITFDDEQVLVLGESKHERSFARYDFTR